MISHVDAAVLAGGDPPPDAGQVETVAKALRACVARVEVVSTPAGSPSAPILGVREALSSCSAEALLVVGGRRCDVEPDEVLALLALVATAGPAIVAPAGPDGPDPLFAVYRKMLLPNLDRAISTERLSLRALIEASDALIVPIESLAPLRKLGSNDLAV